MIGEVVCLLGQVELLVDFLGVSVLTVDMYGVVKKIQVTPCFFYLK